jgi:hypothetical protein
MTNRVAADAPVEIVVAVETTAVVVVTTVADVDNSHRFRIANQGTVLTVPWFFVTNISIS